MKTELVKSLATFDEYPGDKYEWRVTGSNIWSEFDWRKENLGTTKELIDLGRLRRVLEEEPLPEYEVVWIKSKQGYTKTAIKDSEAYEDYIKHGWTEFKPIGGSDE